jgi:hypothetical protein
VDAFEEIDRLRKSNAMLLENRNAWRKMADELLDALDEDCPLAVEDRWSALTKWTFHVVGDATLPSMRGIRG